MWGSGFALCRTKTDLMSGFVRGDDSPDSEGTSQLSPQGLQASLREHEANPRQVRWWANVTFASLFFPQTEVPPFEYVQEILKLF